MKRKFLTLVALTAMSAAFAQTKSTGTVTIGGMTVKIDLDSSANLATYTLTGPSDKWFAIGLNATSMSSNTDVVQYGTSLLDRSLPGGHSAPTTDTTNNLTLVSNDVSGTTRTVVATRPLSTGDSKDYTFNYDTITTLNIIWAIGPNTTVSTQHASRGSSTLTFSTVAGVEDAAKVENLLVYPVPASNTITISNQAGLLIDTVRIFDINARLVKELSPASKDETTVIDVASLDNGTYFVEITGNGNKTVKKIQVKH